MSSITVVTRPAEWLAQAMPLLATAPQASPYRYLQRDYGSQLARYWRDEIAAAVAGDESQLFLAYQGEAIAGQVIYTPLPWESGIFQRSMGALRHLVVSPAAAARGEVAGRLLAYAGHWAAEQGVESLLFKVRTDDATAIHALEADGYRLMDTLLDYVYDGRRVPLAEVPRPRPSPDVAIRPATTSDEGTLVAMARLSFQNHFGRFHTDPRIPRAQATELYGEWIRSCCRGYADWVRVAEVDGNPAGIAAWKKPAPAAQAHGLRVGHLSIVGIHPHYAGRGLFTALTYDGMSLLAEMADYIEGPTHINNYPVQRGYDKLRWRIYDAQHAFHKWLTA